MHVKEKLEEEDLTVTSVLVCAESYEDNKVFFNVQLQPYYKQVHFIYFQRRVKEIRIRYIYIN
jgi:hypothetical protein